MKTRSLHRLLAALLVGLFSVPAIAQYTRDASAKQKIDEAINNHYLMMQLDKAEGLLTGTVAACEDKCAPATKAKAWMYVGIVRGSGKNDQAGAAEAFATAKSYDPNIQLDEALATPETKETFQAATGGATPVETTPSPLPGPTPAPAAGAPGAAPPPAGVPGDMLCSPQGAAIGTNMPIPISCTSDADVAEGFVKFKEPGQTDWKKIALQNFEGQWQTEIPCKFTSSPGELMFYVGVKDSAGEYVDQFGSKKDPANILLADDGVAPAFPGQPAVTRCSNLDAGEADCPPDFPGCESSSDTAQCGDLDWGAACKNSSECKCGLLCEAGQCATAPSCTTDEECSTGSCVDGLCSAVRDASSAVGPYKRHWITFNAGMDLMMLGGNNLCGVNEDFDVTYGIQCYDPSGDRQNVEAVNIDTGIALGQIRLKLGYAFAINDHLTLGGMAGFAFLNSHPPVNGEPKFIPVHGEARGTYNFTSLSHDGLRPALYVAAGFAESNAKLVAIDTHLDEDGKPADTRIFKVAGRGFGALGGQLGYYFTPDTGISLDVQFMLLIPPPIGTVLHPSLNFTKGF